MERRTHTFTLAGSRNRYSQCCFSNAALCLPPPCATAELQVIFWPLRQMSFDARKRLSLLVSRSAECRVTTFLIDLSMRMGNSKYLDLPMSHQDIADHLGLTIETLSRTITTLEKSGSIARSSCRTLILRNRASLDADIRLVGHFIFLRAAKPTLHRCVRSPTY